MNLKEIDAFVKILSQWRRKEGKNLRSLEVRVHIEDFTRARVNESDFTAVLVETGAMPVPTKLQNPTACA